MKNEPPIDPFDFTVANLALGDMKKTLRNCDIRDKAFKKKKAILASQFYTKMQNNQRASKRES